MRRSGATNPPATMQSEAMRRSGGNHYVADTTPVASSAITVSASTTR